ncbi:hypothetical protein F5X71_25645 [Nocardia brasiliensis]|uniref:Uncharacterized protein n=1 Tax=Nocardia brasiliensis TaxID=37326 RepID=A0A6G9XWH6_NOCBR|nr:hypothetical protein [Nocardia brasiliensis]QIS05246.1 hypothetical protein F5X71_25645 [Nocardia brasiliensis]
MPARTGTPTVFRLVRIAALVLGSLLFLYACEYSRSAVLADRWIEVACAGLLMAAGLGAAWFEIKLTNFREFADDETGIPAETVSARGPVRHSASGIRRKYAEDRAPRSATHMGRRGTRHDDRADDVESPTVAARMRTAGYRGAGTESEKWWKPGRSGAEQDQPRTARAETKEFLVESGGWSMRAKIGRSGDLLFHGHDRGGTYPAYEWMWIFHPDTFPAIRDALGDPEGDILELLEEVVPQLDRHGRHDPGAWLRAHSIPAAYREKGVSATQDTREIPLLVPGLPRLVPPERHHDPAPHWPQRDPRDFTEPHQPPPRPEVPRREPISGRRPPPGADALGRGPAPIWQERPVRQRETAAEPWSERPAPEYRPASRRRRYAAPPNSTEAPRRGSTYGATPPRP